MRDITRVVAGLLVVGALGAIVLPQELAAQRQTFTQELVLDDDQNLPTPATITLRTPAAGTPGFASYTITLPETPPSAQSVLTSNLAGQLEWIATIPQAGGWALAGNTGTVAGTNFLGTTDNVALQIHVNNQADAVLPTQGNGRVMRFEPNATSANIIGGFKANSVTAGAVGATIAGGGTNTAPNQVTSATANFATILGGTNNQVSAQYGTILGGAGNRVSGDTGTAMGNDAQAIGVTSTAMGSSTRARGVASLAAGQSTRTGANTTQATAAAAFGQSTRADGDFSFAAGQSSRATADASFAAGLSARAEGDYSFAVGNAARATANNSVALGQNMRATAANAIAIGGGGPVLTNNVASSLMVGFNSTLPTLFVGPNSGNADNKGNVGIGTSTPASRLVVVGEDDDAAKSILNVTDDAGESALFVTNDRRVGIGGITDPGPNPPTNNARLHVAGLTNGVFGIGRPVSYAMIVNNAVGDPLLRIRDDGRMQLRTANAAFSGLTTRGSIGPAVDNTYDLGSCALQWRDLYLGNNLIFDCVPGAPDLNSAEMSYDQTNAYLDVRVTDGTVAPATAMVIAEDNRRVGMTDGTGTAFSATGPQGALDIRSTTGALIIPRITYAQRTGAGFPTIDGSMVYQTDDDPGAGCPGGVGCEDEGFYFYEAGAWVAK